MRLWIILTLAGSGLAIDRLTKAAFQAQSADRGLSLIPHILAITQHQNYGVVANFPIPRLLIIFLTFIALGVLVALFLRTIRRDAFLPPLALALTIAGAVGNLWDRIAWGYVFDWILLFDRSIINVADMLIAVGLLTYATTHHKKSALEKKTGAVLDTTVKTP
jgi:signal peptidase II